MLAVTSHYFNLLILVLVPACKWWSSATLRTIYYLLYWWMNPFVIAIRIWCGGIQFILYDFWAQLYHRRDCNNVCKDFILFWNWFYGSDVFIVIENCNTYSWLLLQIAIVDTSVIFPFGLFTLCVHLTCFRELLLVACLILSQDLCSWLYSYIYARITWLIFKKTVEKRRKNSLERAQIRSRTSA